MTDHSQAPRGYNIWELGVAAVFLLIGLYMVFEGARYGFGSIVRIGPGFFPASIGVIMMILAVAIGLEVRHSLAEPPRISLRIVGVVGLALLAFALLVVPAGLVTASFAVIFISRFAEAGNSLRTSILLAGGLAAVAWLVFIFGLNMPLKAFWW